MPAFPPTASALVLLGTDDGGGEPVENALVALARKAITITTPAASATRDIGHPLIVHKTTNTA